MGVWGMLLAVPMLMTVKTVCDHIEELQPLADFLGDLSSPPLLARAFGGAIAITPSQARRAAPRTARLSAVASFTLVQPCRPQAPTDGSNVFDARAGTRPVPPA